jgi:serine/threonine protein kinase
MSSDFSADFRYVFQGPATGASVAKGLEGVEGGGGGLFEAYEVREQIGKGSFASVRKGVQKRTGKLVAIKIIEKAVGCNASVLSLMRCPI